MSAFTQHEDLASSESLIASIFEEGDTIGVAFCDTSEGIVSLGEFKDDSFCSSLRILGHQP